ncbi:MAG: MFS transporter permease [Actinomycetes bacterium]
MDRAVTRWLTAPVARARVAWLRTLLYLFVPVDVLLTTPWVAAHDTAPASLYRPLFVGRLLEHPAPTYWWVHLVQALLLAAAVVAATGRAPRLLGISVFVLYFEWMLIAMSYGKVDHDRLAFLVALAALPTVGAARHRDRTPSEAAGFAVRCITAAVVATYVLSVAAKHRFGGGLPNWLESAVFVRAVLRRGTPLGDLLLDAPWLLHLSQYGLVAMELAAPVLLLLTGRRLYAALAAYALFHLGTWAAIAIVFLPHLVCFLAFLPLERLLPERQAAEPDDAPGRSDGGSAHAGVPPGRRWRLSATTR